ncbi:MAG: hypothetical protein CM15mP9_6070 [Methanobacteriota archaeon]|nr:MAG: hypothetical protein CM15mP9_6070 [Euryarchaeota archaeon]
MADSPSRPKRPTAARALSSRAGTLSANAVATPNVQLGVIGETRYVVNSGLQKFAQLILFGIAWLQFGRIALNCFLWRRN